MGEMRWVKIISWHRIRVEQVNLEGDAEYLLLCGRTSPVTMPAEHDLPMTGKTCETCLRIEALHVEEVVG